MQMQIAMIIQQAGALAGHHIPIMSEQQLRNEIRIAKAEGILQSKTPKPMVVMFS